MLKVKLGQLSSLVLALLCVFSTSVSAQTASVTLSETSAQLGYGYLISGSDYGRTEIGVEFLYNSNDAYIVDTSLLVYDEVGSKLPGLVAGLGGKIYGAAFDSQEYLALGLGGIIRYAIPQNNRIIIGLDGYYAPPIVSFFNAGRFYEWAARVGYEILPKASAYVEYRQFYVENDNGTGAPLEEGFRVGMKITF